MTSVPFDVSITNDNTIEGNEDFTLTIIRNTLPDRVDRGNPFRLTVTIVDDESKWSTGLRMKTKCTGLRIFH